MLLKDNNIEALTEELISFSFKNDGEPDVNKDISAYLNWRRLNKQALKESFLFSVRVLNYAEENGLDSDRLQNVFQVDKTKLLTILTGKYIFKKGELEFYEGKLLELNPRPKSA